MPAARASHRVLLVLTAVALACGRGGAGSPRTLVYYESYDPRSLDPALSTDVPTGEMVTLLFDGLTAFDADGRLVPGLSDGWTVDRAGRHYVFHLRTGAKFHDGGPLTAGAVVASFRRVLDSRTTGGRAWPLLPIAGAAEFAAGKRADVSGLRALADTAVAIDLAEPLAIFPKFLAMPVASIVPDPAPADLAQRPVGTGPWRFVSWQHDDQLTFAKNPGYWGGAPLADTLRVRIIPEPLTLAAEFEARRVSVIEIPFSETARWQNLHPTWLVRKPALRVIYLALNNRRGALQDVRVRQAINYGVDVGEILRGVYADRGIRARGAIPPVLPGGDTTRAGYTYDPERARALLASAGYANGLDLQLWISATNVPLARVAEAIQAHLARIGIRAEIVARDASSQRAAARAGKADMALLDWWADYPDADNFLYPLFASASFGPGGNYAFYSDPATDSLIAAARRTTNDSARVALYRRIDERVYRAAPWLYLWFPVDLWARQPYVAGWDLPVIFNGQHWARAVATP